MTPGERDVFMGRLLAAWPVPKMSNETKDVWRDHLAEWDFAPARMALAKLEKSSKHRPSLSEMHLACGGAPTAPQSRPGVPLACGVCEDGWVDLTPDGPRPHTWQRCPNGCKPMNADERAARNMAEDAAWDRKHPREGKPGALVAVRDFSEATHRPDEEPF